MQVYTPYAIQNFKSNLYVEIGVDIKDEEKNYGGGDYSEYYFQILIFDEDSSTLKLVYGEKKYLLNKYYIKKSLLPTRGVKVDRTFLSQKPKNKKLHGSFSTIRFLLQCRKLSQIMSSTWLNLHNITDNAVKKTQLISKIFNSYNIVPKTYWLDENGLSEITELQLEENILKIEQKNRNLLTYLIKPTHIGYSSISLALLLSGQAYYKDGDKWETICDSILSTYEIIWEYALDISWDTFYAHKIDLSQAGGRQQPPFTKVTLGYPPRPDQFSLNQEDIKTWTNAKDDDIDGNKYPFYPPKTSQKWENQELEFVAPPFPYIPLSTS